MRERGKNFKMREINASPTPGKELVEHRNKFINSKSILADIQGVDVVDVDLEASALENTPFQPHN